MVLCVQDTTELDFSSKKQIAGLGPLSYAAQHGMYLHPTLALTPEGLCLGVLDAWMWARDPETHGQDDKRALPIEAKESVRWLEGFARVAELAERLPGTPLVYVADRECDIHEFMVRAQAQPAAWLIRAVQPRRTDKGAGIGEHLAQVLGQVAFVLPRAKGRPSRPVTQTLRAERVVLQPRRGKPVEVTARLACEETPPPGAMPVGWRLLTNLLVETLEQAAEKIDRYRRRWVAEVFFRILKSSCEVEALQLSALERLEPALALYLIIAWRVLYLTTLGQRCPELPCEVVFDEAEWRAVYIVSKRQPPPPEPPALNEMLRLVAGFGGYLGRKGDGPPGPKAVWTGLQRARDFVLGVQAMASLQREMVVCNGLH